MPHIFDFDGLEKKLFSLKHIYYGNSHFCDEINLNRVIYNGEDYEWYDYTAILKTIVSETIIEAAIKIRMIQDLVKSEDEEVNLSRIDFESISGLDIGKFIKGNGKLTLRESCNKIIHATEARMQWVNVDIKNESSNEYWNGMYDLFGANKGEEWHLELNVPVWCTGMIRFNKNIQEAVDWYHVYKYDE